MEKILLIIALILISLSGCNSVSESMRKTPETTETINQQTEEGNLNEETTESPVEEISQQDENIIDFTFTKSINEESEPFSFRIIGSVGADITRIIVENIQISNADGELIQEISDISAIPPEARKTNFYGLKFDDFNSDGYLDMTIRRFPGTSSNNRTNYYWLWDDKSGQFVYDWILSEVVTEENMIDFQITQSIHDEIEPFTFRLFGRWIEGWSSEVDGMVEDIDANIHIMQIIDSDGNILQEFDRIGAFPPPSECSFGLHFADYNFDGYLDATLYMFQGGSMRNSPHRYWLWDNGEHIFVENVQLSEISNYSTISINEEECLLECYTRFNAGAGIVQHYKYIDGEYVFIYSNELGNEPDPNKEGEYLFYEIIRELVDGEIITTKNYIEYLK